MRPMGLEVEPYNYPFDDSSGFEKTRRGKRDPNFRKIDATRVRKPAPNNQDFAIPPKEVKMPNFELLRRDFPDQAHFISLFIAAKGPQSAAQGAVYISNLQSDSERDMQEGEIMRQACGITFERLSHLWLKSQLGTEKEDTKILDPGSTNRLFSNLWSLYNIGFIPDGAMIHNFSTLPVLSGLYEYKMSPVKHQDRLKSQIEKMKHFFSEFSGRQLRINTKLDKHQPSENRTIRISDHPFLTLVMPEDNPSIIADAGITILSAPFRKKFIVAAAVASLKDFGDLARLPREFSS